MTINYLTAEAYKKLKEELEYLRKVKRKEIAQRVQEAKELGDLSENADYQKAKEDQAALESRIIELEEFLKRAVIIQPKKTDRVEIGSIIEVENLSQSTSKKQVFTIVGSHEAQPLEGKISNESPLGKAFLGKKVGEIADVETPKGKVQYKILKIK
ncbi:MAG TPA: transcription elongation factor GreA [Candidatus Paceibacterota bacterium]|jgi:transcription elongation factor GreA|nr:transcription elongation factor GreA [Candidatus Paceibacterota bacterium]HRR45608.1 transcription elongation factor GreA [Candidatus Paceibacterota bacterium]